MLWYFILHIRDLNWLDYVRNNNPDEDLLDGRVALNVNGLGKKYSNKPVVDKLSFAVQNNQCYGLLGPNGAGKTTTFQMLSKLLRANEGFITLADTNKNNMPISRTKYWEKIGYCPQENYLNFYLTGRQLIKTFLRIKGYSEQHVNDMASSYLKDFGLQEDADKPCSQYSGGNKRKLSTCLAFLGKPKVIILDEPTSGMDPTSQRKIWKILSKLKQKKKCSFVLSSHNMEECENLCDELSIMKDGKIHESGSILAFKNRYGNGFRLDIKLKESSFNIESLNSEFAHLNAMLIESYNNVRAYWIQHNDKKLSQLFSKVEELKMDYSSVVDDYTIRDLSLEDVFLIVANAANVSSKPDQSDSLLKVLEGSEKGQLVSGATKEAFLCTPARDDE